MKPLLSALCTWLLLPLLNAAIGAEQFRTDINPALLYHQAFALAPELSEDEQRHFHSTEWRGRKLDSGFEATVVKYDNVFKLTRRAAKSRVPCDWGVDLTQGPEALLPALAKAKNIAQTARLRVLWHLNEDRQADARDDLLAAFVLARNLASDGVLIEALVQFAMESILASVVAENFFEFDPGILNQIVAGFDAAPGRTTLKQCMAVEKSAFLDWFVAQIQGIQRRNPGNEAAALSQVKSLLARTLAEEGKPNSQLADRVIAASDSTTSGVIASLQALEPLHAELTSMLALPYAAYAPAVRAFEHKLEGHPNPLAMNLLSAIPRSRQREFHIQTKLAMVRAAVAYRLEGARGLRSVADPCGDAAFGFEPLVVSGAERGFVLKSKLNTRGFDEVLVFARNIPPALYIDGQNAGKPIPKTPVDK